jgi:hypothetical protein
MRMQPDVLTFLLKGGHLNVEERKKLGLWPTETLKYNDILEHLTSVLEKVDLFPDFSQENKNNNFNVREGIIIQRKSSDKFVCYSQRSSVSDSNIIAEKTETEFSTAKEAASFYLKWELHLPGRLDSWPVI